MLARWLNESLAEEEINAVVHKTMTDSTIIDTKGSIFYIEASSTPQKRENIRRSRNQFSHSFSTPDFLRLAPSKCCPDSPLLIRTCGIWLSRPILPWDFINTNTHSTQGGKGDRQSSKELFNSTDALAAVAREGKGCFCIIMCVLWCGARQRN